MSTKIYDAVRFPQRHLEDVLRHYDQHAVTKAREQFERNVHKFTCPHPPERVRCIGVYETYATKKGRTLIVPPDGMKEPRFATGECQDCGTLLKGFATAAPNVPLPTPGAARAQDAASLLFAQRKVTKEGGALATQAEWHRTKPDDRRAAVSKALEHARRASLSTSRMGAEGDFDIDDQLDSSVRFRFHRGFVYLQHLGEANLWEGITWPKALEVEDYEYWDNTDAPKGVTEPEWRARRLTWEAVTKDRTIGWMTYSALDFGRSHAHAWGKVDPSDEERAEEAATEP